MQIKNLCLAFLQIKIYKKHHYLKKLPREYFFRAVFMPFCFYLYGCFKVYPLSRTIWVFGIPAK